MNNRHSVFALGLVVALLVAGLIFLFRLRLGQGDVFPVYSSLRADPLGTLALHDSMRQLPGWQVERRYKKLEQLAPAKAQTILLAGVREGQWARFTTGQSDALQAAVRAGSRLVIALRAKTARAKDADVNSDPEFGLKLKPKAEPKKKKAPPEKTELKEEKPVPPEEETEPEEGNLKIKMVYADLAKSWGAELLSKNSLATTVGADRVAEAGGALPLRIGWRSDLYFKLAPDAPWRVLYRRGGEPVLVERPYGLGTIVLAADSFFLSNEALQDDRATALLAWIIGSHGHVVFDESHLGVVADPGIAALARRYGLSGAFFTLLVLAALFVWRRLAQFVPPADEARELTLAYHPSAGLEALLQRAVPAHDLVAVGVAEWQRTARVGERARATTAQAAIPGNATPVERYNLLTRALRHR